VYAAIDVPLVEQFLCLEQSFMASAELYGLGA